MKREPNPYSKNPMLTVTSTMSISVPSMVAEDVLDGDADKITGVDPAVLDEIKDVSVVAALAYSEVVALQDTVDTIKSDMDNTSRLAYGIQAGYTGHPSNAELTVDTADGTGLAYFRLTGNGHDVSVSVHDLQNLVNGNIGGGSTGSSGSSSSSYVTYENLAQAQIRFDSNYDTVSIQAADKLSYTDLTYYKLAAPGFVSSDWPNAQLRLYGNAGSNIVQLELSSDYGKTWHPITSGDSGSSSDSTSTLSGFAGVYKDYDSTCLDYKLGLDLDPETRQAYLIVKNGSAEDWQPLQLGSGSTSGSTTQSEVITLDSYHLDELMFSYEDGFLYTSAQGSSESMLNYCSGISCCYFRDPSGSPWIHHAEMRFTKNTDTDDVEIQLRRDDAHDWITVASTADASSPGSGSTSGSVTTLTSITNSMHGVKFNSRDQAFINAHDGYIVRSESNRLVSKQHSGSSVHDDMYPYLELHGSSTLRWFDGGGVNEIELASLASGGSSTSGGSSFYWSDTKILASSIVATLSYPGYSDRDTDAVLIDNPLYAGQYNSRPCAVRPYISSNGTLTWKRRTASGDWTSVTDSGSSSGSAAGVYELGLLDNGYDSGSHMVPLIEETSTSLSGGDRGLTAVRWSIGASTQIAKDLSGVYTLMANPLALFGYHFNSIYDIHITGAIRPMLTSAGNLAWQKLDYSAKQWKPISSESAEAKIEITEVYEGIFNVKAEKYDYYQGKNVLVNVPALTSGLGAVFNNTSIVACLKADTASSLHSSGVGIQKTGWSSQYTSFYGGEYDITELVVRAPQICEIASHLSQIQWLCENTESIKSLLNK